MELDSEKYNVNKREFYFRWNVRARIQFEKMTGITVKADGDPGQDDDDVTEEEAFMMAYCGTVAGMRKEQQPFEMSFDEYLDFVDMDVEPIIKLFEKFVPKGQPQDPAGEKKKQIRRRKK